MRVCAVRGGGGPADGRRPRGALGGLHLQLRVHLPPGGPEWRPLPFFFFGLKGSPYKGTTTLNPKP